VDNDILQDIISALHWADILHLSTGLDGNVEHLDQTDTIVKQKAE